MIFRATFSAESVSAIAAWASLIATRYGISKAHREAFRKGFIAHRLGYKRAQNCYASTGFRSAWFDGWDDSKVHETTINFSAGSTVESKRRKKC